MTSKIINHTIQSVKNGLEKGDFSAEEIFNEYLQKIGKENPELHAYLNVFDSDVSNVKLLNAEGLLAGVPCAIKDNILIDGTICTAGSKILKNYQSAYDATVISKLKKEGTVFLGKTNLDEFAMGASTENSAFGPTKNPHDITRVPGGTSGGSAAAVAADLCVFALGSDTGGSIRQPASFCGVVGLRPTYGLVSRNGLMAMASSLDQIGPITKNVYDSACVLNIISGYDRMDATTVSRETADYTKNLKDKIKELKIGLPKEYFGEGLDGGVKAKVMEAIEKLKSLGAEVIEISLPHTTYAVACYYIVVPSEVSANLARFDGIRYGYSEKDAENLFDVYAKSRAYGMGAEPRRRILLGTYALSSGYYDAYYLKAQKVRALIKKDFTEAFKKVDLIVSPTTPTTAFKFGEKMGDPLSMYLADIYTAAVSLAGIPAISIPCGSSDGMPVGFQIIADQFEESKLLNTAYQLEKELAED